MILRLRQERQSREVSTGLEPPIELTLSSDFFEWKSESRERAQWYDIKLTPSNGRRPRRKDSVRALVKISRASFDAWLGSPKAICKGGVR